MLSLSNLHLDRRYDLNICDSTPFLESSAIGETRPTCCFEFLTGDKQAPFRLYTEYTVTVQLIYPHSSLITHHLLYTETALSISIEQLCCYAPPSSSYSHERNQVQDVAEV